MLDDNTREMVNRYLINETDFLKRKDSLSEEQLRQFVGQAINDVDGEKNLDLTIEEKGALIRELVSAVISMGPIRPLMEDETVTEIMVNGANQIYIQRHGRIYLTDIKFESNRQLMHTVQKILSGSGSNRRVDESSPYVDFSLADGSRVNVILPPCSMVGPIMTIRKFKDDIGTVDDLLELGMLDKQIATLLTAAMKAKLNVIFCGSTGAGKTTTLNVFSRHIPQEERIVTIEDTPELRLLQEHVVPLASKPPNIEGKGEITMRELFVNSLRMRPDRIIIGEIRGEEMLDLIQSISSGHSGSLAIVHADTPEDCFNRMVTMMLMTGIRLSTPEIRKQVARAIDIVVHIELFMDGKRRITNVTDIYYDEDNDKVHIRDMIKYIQSGLGKDGEVLGEWEKDARVPSFYDKFAKKMVTLPEGYFKNIMNWSKFFIPTSKEVPVGTEAVSHQLLLRAGLVHMLTSGVYTYLPLGLRVLSRIEKIIQEEMNNAGAVELFMPCLQPMDLWKQTGRDETLKEVMIRFDDKKGRPMCLGPTHEEVITAIVKDFVQSYRQLPFTLYQIQTKFRDELRTRFGIVRACEFIMKDAYSFDRDKEGLQKNYDLMYEAYQKIFKRCGLEVVIVEADSGAMGGDVSHEFMVPAPIGEDIIYEGTDQEQVCIELGHIFQLGTKYSDSLGAKFLDENGKEKPIIMGCYGIGVSRVIAAIIEKNNDEKGIIWPKEVSPFDVEIIPIVGKDGSDEIMSLAKQYDEELTAEGFDVLVDDRSESPGRKFNDADLIGIPLRIVVGQKNLVDGNVEIKNRRTDEVTLVKKEEAKAKILELLK